MIDLGLGGMSMHLAYAIPPGVNCRIRFSLFIQNGIEQIDLQAQTVNSVFQSDQVRVSLRFPSLTSAASKLLGDYVRFQTS